MYTCERCSLIETHLGGGQKTNIYINIQCHYYSFDHDSDSFSACCCKIFVTFCLDCAPPSPSRVLTGFSGGCPGLEDIFFLVCII